MRVVWAVDAFDKAEASQKGAADLIRMLRERCEVTVHPAHVLNPAELDMGEDSLARGLGRYRIAVEHAVERLLADLGVRTERPVVFSRPGFTVSRSADVLAHYAEGLGADLILAGTHARGGVSRMILGSFAETLLRRAEVPVLVVGPRLRAGCDLGNVLVPADFSEAGVVVFRRVARLARELGSRLTLLHAAPRAIEAAYQSGVYLLGGPWVVQLRDDLGRELSRQERHAEAWARWARNQGIDADVVVDTDAPSVAEAIRKAVLARGIGWVAMASQEGPFASAILGSLPRQVIREAGCPVWVLRSSREASRAA